MCELKPKPDIVGGLPRKRAGFQAAWLVRSTDVGREAEISSVGQNLSIRGVAKNFRGRSPFVFVSNSLADSRYFRLKAKLEFAAAYEFIRQALDKTIEILRSRLLVLEAAEEAYFLVTHSDGLGSHNKPTCVS